MEIKTNTCGATGAAAEKVGEGCPRSHLLWGTFKKLQALLCFLGVYRTKGYFFNLLV
jgi:hypothetical protein